MISPGDAALLASIRAHEGRRTVVYDDANGEPLKPGDTLQGKATIGYGTNLHVPMSESSITGLLRERTVDAFGIAIAYPYFSTLSEDRQRVLTEMAYQLGAGGFRSFRRMHAALQTGRYDDAADEMLDSKWAQSDSPERAHTLSERMRKG